MNIDFYSNIPKRIIMDSRGKSKDFPSILMGDSDSAYINPLGYMKRNGMDVNDDKTLIVLADDIQKSLASLVPHLIGTLLKVPMKRRDILVPGREIVGNRGLFLPQKKRYAIHVIDDEGFAPKKGKEIKIKGLDAVRSDTPVFVQDFLKQCIVMILTGSNKDDIYDYVSEFRATFGNMYPWEIGSTGRVSKININTELLNDYDNRRLYKSPLIHYYSKSAINTNRLKKIFNDTTWKPIQDGDKISILYLKNNNEFAMKYVALPIEEVVIPDWFKKLPFDRDIMEYNMIDKKLEHIFLQSLGWTFELKNHHIRHIGEDFSL